MKKGEKGRGLRFLVGSELAKETRKGGFAHKEGSFWSATMQTSRWKVESKEIVITITREETGKLELSTLTKGKGRGQRFSQRDDAALKVKKTGRRRG